MTGTDSDQVLEVGKPGCLVTVLLIGCGAVLGILGGAALLMFKLFDSWR